MALNKVILMGNVGSDPEIRGLQGGGKVASFRLATSEKYKDRNGDAHENTEWHNIVVWNNSADFVEKYIKKGSLVLVEGKLTTRQWEDRNGAKRSTTEVKAESIQKVGPSSRGEAEAVAQAAQAAPAIAAAPPQEDDDIPF